MSKELLISIPEYWAMDDHKHPDTFKDLMKKINRKGGFWCLTQCDNDGNILQEQWCENLVTINGANSLLKNTFNSSSAGIAVANIIAIDQSLTYTTLSTSIAASATITSITVGALTPAVTIPSGTQLVVGAGGAASLTVTLMQSITGAGTYTVTSVTNGATAIPAGSNIKMVPSSADVSSLSAPVSYTAALPSAAFDFSVARQVTITNSGAYVFSSTANSNPSVATVATYTAAWLVNTNPVGATTQTFVHMAFNAPLSVSAGTTIQMQIIEQL